MSIIPGLGQVANGDTLEGIGWFASTAGMFFSGNNYAMQIGFDLWFYNMYDAYRDAGAKNTTQYTLIENWAGNFNPMNVVDPVGASIIAAGAIGGSRAHFPTTRRPGRLLTHTVVGLGEEGVFRGFLYPGFSNLMGSRVAGALASSAIFSYAHRLNGNQDVRPAIFLQRTFLGLLFCLQATWNDYDLRKNIFAHSWFNILVDRTGKLSGGSFTLPF